MRVLSAASVLVTLVFCTADDVPRWSKPDDIRSQGEWVPLNDDRISQQPIRISSAITSPRHNHERSFPHHNPANQFLGDYPKQQMVASQTAPQRLAFVNPSGLNQQQILQPQLQPQLQLQQQLPTQLQPQIQQQLDSQQLLTQFLNQQIQQASLPIFNRALLQKEPAPSPHYFAQPNQYNIMPTYNQGQLLPNEQYTVGSEREIENDERVISKDTVRQGIPDSSYEKLAKTKYSGEPFNSNLSAGNPNQKEEIQILYVPIEMLKQQEQNLRNKAAGRKPEFNQPLSKDLYSPELGGRNPDVSQINNQKESRKFRHPIQPLKEQVPAYHLKQPTRESTPQGKAVYSNGEVINEQSKETKQIVSNRDYKDYPVNYKPHPPSREYTQRYETENSNFATSGTGNKEQNVDETTIKDEVSDYKHAQQDRISQKDYVSKPEPSLPPPNQPPLSVFMEKTTSSRIGDLVSLLRGSKTIPVLDSIGPDSPQVFVGPSNLNTPSGYIKYELPYLSSLDKYQTGNKLSQVPFFVAPLNFQPPPGFAKIPFPPPHIGSVVLSNISQQTSSIHQNPSSQSNPDLRASNYNKETFTIPADISSISPQLPSLINSLQEEEYSSSSSTETLTETTEATPIKQRRPSGSRRFNSRGSQRGSVSYSSTTKRPSVSRQRRPLNRNTNYRTNHYSEAVTNVPETPGEHQYEPDGNYYQYKSSRDSSDSTEKDTLSHKVSDTSQLSPDDRQHATGQYIRNIGNAKEEESSNESINAGPASQNPGYISKYSNDDIVATTPEQTLNGAYYSPDTINKNIAHSSSPQYKSVPTSGETYDEYQPSNFDGKSTRNNLSPADKRPGSETTLKYEEPVIYKQGTPLTYPEVSSITNDYEEVNYRKRHRENTNVQPSITEQNYNYRQKEQRIESPHVAQDTDYSRETVNKDEINLQPHAREQEQQHQTIEDRRNLNSQYNGYVSSNEEQNTTPYIQKSSYESASQESLEPYRDVQSPEKLSVTTTPKKHSYHDSQQIVNKNEDYNERTHYDSNISETPKPTTERTFPTRSRSRGRGRPYHQYKATSTEPPINSSEESDDNSHYTRSDVTTSSPGRRYSHSRAHRRPLRPTASTTTTTTTNAPPGTKYLIRTRRPTVAQTKLHNGRGRIRRPTTPTTTVATTTTEHLQTLPVLWQQPHRLSPSQSDYRTKDSSKHTHSPSSDSAEYVEETPQYSDERVHDKSTYEPQNDRNQDLSQGTYKKYPENDLPRRVPVYSYETQEENFPTQKQFRATPQPYYTDEYETTPKVHYSRNYETTQKQQQYRDYETTQKPQYSKDYETTQKVYYPRDYETTQRTQYSRPYDTTQKQQNARDYDTTEKAQYLKEYETTDKPKYSREYETTPKQHYYREYETTQKPQYYREYETTQNPTHYRSHDSNPSPKYFNEYDTTKKVVYSDEYETTEKPKNYKESTYYDTTKKPVNYQDYETTPRPYISDSDTNEKHSYVHTPKTSHRASNHRRRPSTVTTRYDSSKPAKTTREEVPVKEQDSDYWNQGVTIQQSQSYVFNPDETYSEERQVASPKDSKYESSQNDYDDYYNPQESEQYSSDQSPYPSNEQKITYTQIKEGDYIGKASQYPRKDANHNEDKILEAGKHSQKNDSTRTDFPSSDINQETPIMEYEADQSSSNESEDTYQNSKITQGNKKRGTWVRRRIKKPKDLFETAESQRISSVRENSLVAGLNPEELQIKNYAKEQFKGKQKESNHNLNETNIGQSAESETKNTENSKDDKSEIGQKSSSEEIKEVFAKETTTEITTDKDEAFNTYQTPSVTTLSLDTMEAKDTSEPYRTSTTTEISLETEICYKGQCIKTKRRKEDKDAISIPNLET